MRSIDSLPMSDVDLCEYIIYRTEILIKKRGSPRKEGWPFLFKEPADAIVFPDRDELLILACIAGIQHSGMANRKLLQKFGRLKEAGVVIDFPGRVKFPFIVRVL